MIRIDLKIALYYQIYQHEADFLFNIHAAHTPQQRVCAETLTLSQPLQPVVHTDPVTGTRQMRVRAQPGELSINYSASIELDHRFSDPASLGEVCVHELPSEALPYLLPSRYCQSDMVGALACSEFGHLPRGYSRVLAIRDWVRERVAFTSNVSNCSTSALETLNDGAGVCRDFAHVMVALCRSLNIPARIATGTDYGADPALGPPDFHAYVEVWLDNGWYIFDPSGTTIPMGCVRLATGRDAADVAFASIFGNVATYAPVVEAIAQEDAQRNLILPHECGEALSTDAGSASGMCMDVHKRDVRPYTMGDQVQTSAH